MTDYERWGQRIVKDVGSREHREADAFASRSMVFLRVMFSFREWATKLERTLFLARMP